MTLPIYAAANRWLEWEQYLAGCTDRFTLEHLHKEMVASLGANLAFLETIQNHPHLRDEWERDHQEDEDIVADAIKRLTDRRKELGYV